MSRKRPFRWNESKQLKKLVNITSEHDVENLRIMTLNEFRESKKRDVFEQIVELGDYKVSSLLNDDDIDTINKTALVINLKERIAECKRKFQSLDEVVRKHVLNCDYPAAIKVYNDIINICSTPPMMNNNEAKEILEETKKELDCKKPSLLTDCCNSLLEKAKSHYDKGEKDNAKSDYDIIVKWCRSSGLTDRNDIRDLMSQAESAKKAIDLEAFHSKKKEQYDKAKALEQSDHANDLDEAIGIYEELSKTLSSYGWDNTFEEGKIEKLQKKIDCIIAPPPPSPSFDSLPALLDEKFTMGPNTGDFKVKNLKMCLAKVKKWLKDDNNRTELTNEEKEALVNTVHRIKLDIKKPKFDNEWKELAKYLGDEKTLELFNE